MTHESFFNYSSFNFRRIRPKFNLALTNTQAVLCTAVTMCDSHSVSPVTAVIHGGRHGHDDGRNAVSHHVEIALARVLAFKHLYQHDVELNAFKKHPRERRQEEEVQKSSEDSAGDLKHKCRTSLTQLSMFAFFTLGKKL